MAGIFDLRFPTTGVFPDELPSGVTALTDPFTPVPKPRPLQTALQPPMTPDGGAEDISPSPGGGDVTRPPPASPDGGGSGGFSNKLIQGLRGASAPPRPDVVKPSTPSLPRTTPIHSGELLAMLNALSNPRTQAMARPTTLGGALGIGRY
jgi:hypothetical protein